MPLVKVYATKSLPETERTELLASLSRILSEELGKPERYVMAILEDASIMMSQAAGDAAFVDVRSIGGLSTEVNAGISRRLGELLTESLGIPAGRIYLNFSDVPPGNWGWNGETFG